MIAIAVVTTAVSDESSANPFAQAHDQYGDYEGIVAFGGLARLVRRVDQ